MTSTTKSNRGMTTALWVILAASVIGNIYLMMDRSKLTEASQEQATQLTEAEQLNSELEKQYYEALSDLEEMRGSNAELNTMIETQKEELKQQKNKIAGLIKNGRDLKSAREELNNLKEQAAQYVAEIETLKAENDKLLATNMDLEQQKSDLTMQVEEGEKMNEELTTAKAALISEKEVLMEENTDLSAKVNLASVVKISNIDVEGIKLKDNGKERSQKKAKNIDHLKVCFDVSKNEIAESGIEQFFVRVINPTGETMTFENFGSGVMVNQNTGDQIRYTLIKGVQYANEAANTCFDWAPDVDWAVGDYSIEIFNKGYLVGSQAFSLK